jgi:hypothetical protein
MRTFNGLTKRKKSGTVAAQAAEAETQAESWDIHDAHMAAAASEAQHGGDETQQAAFGQASEPDAMSGGAAAAAGDDADDLGGEVVRIAKESETLRVHQVCVSDGGRSQGAMMASMDVSASEMSFGQFMEKYAPFLLSVVSRLVLYRSFFIYLSFSISLHSDRIRWRRPWRELPLTTVLPLRPTPHGSMKRVPCRLHSDRCRLYVHRERERE